MVLTCIWTTPSPVIRCSTIPLLALSMPGAGVVHYIIRDPVEPVANPAKSAMPPKGEVNSEH
jgi:hypothetical protein